MSDKNNNKGLGDVLNEESAVKIDMTDEELWEMNGEVKRWSVMNDWK